MRQFERYSFFYDQINSNRNFSFRCGVIEALAKNPKSILDIGCGTAHYWKYFKAQKVQGIEISKQMISLSPYKENIVNADILTHDYHKMDKYDAVTAVFDVMNYLPSHDFWHMLPIKKRGYFVFDIWNKSKILDEGFKTTTKSVGGISRTITPKVSRDMKTVRLNIFCEGYGLEPIRETHTMYIYSPEDIQNFCGEHYKIRSVIHSASWETWYQLERIK